MRHVAMLMDAFIGAWFTYTLMMSGVLIRVECRYFTGLMTW